jgi:hypothetical protein
MEETIDLLETIDICYKEYKTRLDNYELIRNEYYSTEKYEYVNKHPLKVVRHIRYFIQKGFADIESSHKLLLISQKSFRIVNKATSALKDAIHNAICWFRFH